MNSENNIVITPEGTVMTPNLHDGLLVGLLFPGDRRVLLAIKNVLSTLHCIELTGVINFRANDVWEGNIILDMTVNSGDEVKSQEVAHALGIEGNPAYEAYLEKRMKQFRAKEILLVQLSSSYGCEFTCICSGIGMAPSMVPMFNHLLTPTCSDPQS